MTKKVEEINPQIIKKDIELPYIDMKTLNQNIDINTILDTGKEDEDSFFKSVVTQLFNNKDVETKTRNKDYKESFVLARLSHIAEQYSIPNMESFVERLERKRISIEGKGRSELVTALLERQQELERLRIAEQNKMLGRVS